VNSIAISKRNREQFRPWTAKRIAYLTLGLRELASTAIPGDDGRKLIAACADYLDALTDHLVVETSREWARVGRARNRGARARRIAR
jgi:hypothetical protein